MAASCYCSHRSASTAANRHLGASVAQARLTALANAKGIDLSVLVNDLLRKDIELIEMAQ